MKLKRLTALLVASTLVATALTACAGGGSAKVNKNDPYYKNAEAGIFRIAGGYEPPEVAHANVWVPGSAGTILGNTADFIHEKLFDYIPLPEKTYLPVLGESFTEEGNVITMKLRQGVTWNDGTPFTSKDVLATFNLGFIHNWVVWDHLESIEAPDDHTVVVTLKEPNAITTQLVTNVVINSPYHLYKEWADQATTIVANRKPGTDTKYDKATTDASVALRDSLHKFTPEVTSVVGTGPFKIKNLTTSEGVLVKNDKYWNTDQVKMNEVRIMRTSSLEAQMNLIMSKGYDWENLGLSPDVHAQVVKDNPGMRVMLGADLGQPSLQFNQRIAPMDNKLVRQAIHHLIDRESLLLIAEPGSEMPDLTSSGMIPAMRDGFLSKSFQDSLTVYNNDDAKAEALLVEAGWSRNAEGIWVDETGKVVELEFTTTSTYPTYFLCADSIVNQMNEFGIKTQLKAMESSAYFKHLQDQGAMMSVSMRPGSPNYGEPWEIYRSFFLDGAADLGFTTLAEKKAGITNVTLELDGGTKVDTASILHEMLVTKDDARKVELTEYFAKLLNDQSYFVPLVTKYIPQKVYNPYLTGFSDDMADPMWYGGGATRVAARLIREGKLYYDLTPSK
ncbi:MAG: ABC transporter substrate-binding protein [Cellulosilyticaceae bacterium]